jgi:hypothetical protein
MFERSSVHRPAQRFERFGAARASELQWRRARVPVSGPAAGNRRHRMPPAALAAGAAPG